ncbi:MAG: TolC family protein [Gammaproteobacteria bacterium]
MHLAELRYKGGLSNYLDVLTAKRNLFDVELSLTATRRLRLVSMIQLYKALGGGWSPNHGAYRMGKGLPVSEQPADFTWKPQ